MGTKPYGLTASELSKLLADMPPDRLVYIDVGDDIGPVTDIIVERQFTSGGGKTYVVIQLLGDEADA